MYKNNIENITIEEVETDIDSLKKIMDELGISMKGEETYKLILWNDDVNDMMYIIMSLSDICKLSNEECVKIMMEAHEKGKAVAKTGTYDEMVSMKDGLNQRLINATVEK